MDRVDELLERYQELTFAQDDHVRAGMRIARRRAAVIAQMHAGGMSYAQIAAATGMSRARAQQLVERADKSGL